MSNSEVINTSKSADLVTHKILVDGQELSKQYQVKQLLIHKEVNRIPTATIMLLDGEAATRDFALSNETLLIPGVKIEITAGYHNDEEVIFKGIIIKHTIKVWENTTMLCVECKDEAVKMTIGCKSHYFYDSSDSDVFTEIIDGYGLESTIESTSVTHTELVQYNVSDWDFVLSRAQANGLLCFVDDGSIDIAPPSTDGEAVETLTFGANMLSFDAEIDARHQLKRVMGYSWNQADQELVEVEASDPGITGSGNLSTDELADVIGLEAMELRHGGAVADTAMQSWADAKLLYQQLAKIRGQVKFQGIPAVKPGTMIELQGVGDRFNGAVFVSGVRHEITEGNWTVNVQFGLNPEWFSETFDIHQQAASGLISGVKGLQIGVVTQLQDDPDGEDRIMVQLPIVNFEEQGIWCRLAAFDAGESRGAVFRPEIGDEVIVGFINDDPNHAVVLGMLHSSAKPSPIPGSDDNHEKGFVSRSEIKVLFDDDKVACTVETPAGKKLVLDEDEDAITLTDDHGNEVILNADGISMSSPADINIAAQGDVSIEGVNVNCTAQAQFAADGSAGADLTSSAIVKVEGSLVQIN